MRHFALNVYFWGDPEQNRLLTQCVGPAAHELWSARKLRCLWVHRLDARGPHVTVFFSSPAEHAEEAQRRLAERVDHYLTHSPSTVVLATCELEERHDACRGGSLSGLDVAQGFAANNSFQLAEQPVSSPTRSEGAHELDHLLGEQTFWCIEQLRAGTASAGAIRWVAALDRGIARTGGDPRDYWQSYAATLFPTLRERIASGDAEVASTLGRCITSRNRELFGAIWSEAESDPDVAPVSRMEHIAELALSLEDDPAHRWSFTRDLAHAVLAQLGLPVIVRTPLILHAWLHDRRRPRACPAAHAV